MGWTLDYVDSLNLMDSLAGIEVLQNADLAHAQERKKAMNQAQAKPRRR